MNRNTGCVSIIVLIIGVVLLLWSVAFVLLAAGFILLVGGPVIGLGIAYVGWRRVARGREVHRATNTLRTMAGDARADLSRIQSELDYLMLTRGIGTDLAVGDRGEVGDLRREVLATQVLLDAATTPAHLRQALVRAEEVRLLARNYLT